MGDHEPPVTKRAVLPGRWEAIGRPRPADRSHDGGTARPSAPERRRSALASLAWRGAAVVLAAVAAALWLATTAWPERPMTSAPLVLPVAVVVGWAVAARAGRGRFGFDMAGVLATGWSLRLIGLWLRYRDASDALEYHDEGRRLAESFRSLDLAVDAGRPVPGTGALRLASGFVHTLAFDDLLTSFAVFTLAGFVGCVLLVRAVHVALPEADLRRYAAAVMLWPSLWFWPSSLGKEAWMLLALGLLGLGVAHVVAHHPLRSVPPLAGGLVMAGLVRPHVGMLAMAALGIAVLVGAPQASGRRWTVRLVVAALLLAGGTVMADATIERLNLDDLGAEAVGTALENTAEQTSTGNTQFAPVDLTEPLGVPAAVVTVLFRPFPHEVTDVLGAASALEGLLLAAWLAASLPRLRAAVGMARRRPYLLYAAAFTAMFCLAFAAIANFGILVRQRSQVLPFVFVLVCVPAVARAGSGGRRATSGRDDAAHRRSSTAAALPGPRGRDGVRHDPTTPPVQGS